jgi:integrase
MLNPIFRTTVAEALKLERDFDDGEMEIARDNQILTDGQIGVLIRSSGEIDTAEEWDGDWHRIVVSLAATGSRYSQITRMRVGDAQLPERRLMVPNSYKGIQKATGRYSPRLSP